MNRLLSALVLFVALAAVLADDDRKDRSKVPGYTTKYDNVDLKAIVNNDRILRSYVDCCLGKKCTPDGQVLKGHIKDAIENECDKCSEQQKKAVKIVGKALYTKHPTWWKELCDHFDPEAKFQKKYEKFIQDALAESD